MCIRLNRRSPFRLRLYCAGLLLVPGLLSSEPVQSSADLFRSLKFRSIGPAVTGGRIHDVEGLETDPSTIFIATASGGLWKTTNHGTTWIPVFDDQPVSTFGDVAISPSNPQVIWAGTGEQNNRQSTSWGNGIYRSEDGGLTWTHAGLEKTHHIGRVHVHPDDPGVVYVAALGNLWKPTEERGIYRTTDGGRSWKRVLFVNTYTGGVDLVIDPSDPDNLYAAMYQRLRRTWGFNGGGPGSGIYKTTDGGESWIELAEGIPSGDKGRIGLAIARSNTDVLYAMIEHASESGTYRTRDGGESWEKVNDLNQRPMYYSHIYVDPTDENRVYSLATEFYMSEDGGETFRQMPTRPTYDVGVHSDHHCMWIDPNDPEHFYLAGDAGLHETWDRGETYNHINNFAIGQFYAVGVDFRKPYSVYGGMQDNHSWVGPSATRRYIGIINDDWKQIGFGDGMYHQPDPTSHQYVYSNSQNGNLTRVDVNTGDILDIRPYSPEGEPSYRWDWVTPSLISPHDPKTVFFGGNRLFITRDRGVSWERTEDLTRQIDRNQLELMGVLGSERFLSKNDGTSSFGEIVTISQSPVDGDIIWVGADDGNLQISEDGGKTWTEVSRRVKGLPDGTYVSRIVASAHDAGTAYAAFDGHRDGDWSPYLYKTTSFGRKWKKYVRGLPEDGSVNVIVEHPDNPCLLFLGTEHELFISLDGGEQWTAFGTNLPTTLYDDLVIHPRDKDLIVGTHGRSIWILDDTMPLAEWSSGVAESPAHLFSIRTTHFFHYWKTTSYRSQWAFNGENPPFGAILTYYLAEDADDITIQIKNTAGKIVRTLIGPNTGGTFHRIIWDLKHEPPPSSGDRPLPEGIIRSETILPALPRPSEVSGPFVSPGTYTVSLRVGDTVSDQTVRVEGDPLMEISEWEYRERETFLLEILDLQNLVSKAVDESRRIRQTLSGHLKKMQGDAEMPEVSLQQTRTLADTARARDVRLRALRSNIYRLAAVFNGNPPRQGTLYPPTRTHRQLASSLKRRLEHGLAELEALKNHLESK